jgi:hypothetical protein
LEGAGEQGDHDDG